MTFVRLFSVAFRAVVAALALSAALASSLPTVASASVGYDYDGGVPFAGQTELQPALGEHCASDWRSRVEHAAGDPARPRPTHELSAPQSVPSRQAAMLDADVGYNISPEAWFSEYPSIGRTGTFVTDGRGVADAFGGPIGGSQRFTVGLTTNLDRGRVGFFRSRRIERSLGLERGSLRNGFRVTEIPGISSMSPRSPLTGNQFFRGPGQGLPNGAPELVVDSIKTVPWPP